MTGVLLDRAPLRLERLDLASGEQSGWREHEAGETFLYVIGGAGTLELPDVGHPLEPESVVWLEACDRYRLAAAGDGLAVLAAHAEGGRSE